MLNEFMKHKYIKKSASELASDEIVNTLSRKLWNDSGYNVAYMLGTVNYLSLLVNHMRDGDVLTKKYLIACIAAIKDSDDTPAEIKQLVDVVLEEIQKKEN